MALILLAVFIGLPLLEIAVFIEVGGLLGVWPTIAATVKPISTINMPNQNPNNQPQITDLPTVPGNSENVV